MSDLSVSEYNDGELVVDSRLIAEDLGIEHESFIKTVDTYKTVVEEAFGVIRFEIGKPSKGSKGGRPERWALLSEDQSTLLMSFSRNTTQVVKCKVRLVRAFSEAKKLLSQRQPKPQYVPYWYERMKIALSDTEMPLQMGYFCVYREMMSFFCELEARLGYLVPDVNPVTKEHLVPDISIGKRFNDFLRSNDEFPSFARQQILGTSEIIDFRPQRMTRKGLVPAGKHASEVQMYNHVYPKISHGKYSKQPSRSYPEKYLMIFKYFLEQYWIGDFFVPYLVERDAQGLMDMRNRILNMSFSERQALSATLIGKLIPALPMVA